MSHLLYHMLFSLCLAIPHLASKVVLGHHLVLERIYILDIYLCVLILLHTHLGDLCLVDCILNPFITANSVYWTDPQYCQFFVQ